METIIAIITLSVALIGSIATYAAMIGALQNRVKNLEEKTMLHAETIKESTDKAYQNEREISNIGRDLGYIKDAIEDIKCKVDRLVEQGKV